MSQRERYRIALIVGVVWLVMGAAAGVLADQGDALFGLLGLVLIVFAVIGVGQAGAIGLGCLRTGSANNVHEHDAATTDRYRRDHG